MEILSKIKNLILKNKNKKNISQTSEFVGINQDKYLDELELSYLFSIFNLYERVCSLPGHIVELGVGAGRNSILFGNLLKFTSQNSNHKYFGFDTFKNYTEQDFIENPSLEKNREKWNGNSLEYVQSRIKKHGLQNICRFIEGDVRNTLDNFLKSQNLKKSNGTFFCKLLYIDTSSLTPAKIGIEKLYEHMVPGGIIAIDQRTQGGETKAIMDFCNKKSLQINTGKYFNDIPAYFVKKS